MSRFCPETKETVLSQDCVECKTKTCRDKSKEKSREKQNNKKKYGLKPELRL